jgi:hypothetical protein
MRAVQFLAIFVALALGVGAASLDRAPTTRLQLQMAPPDDRSAEILYVPVQERMSSRTEREAEAIPAASRERMPSRETDPDEVIAKNPNER